MRETVYTRQDLAIMQAWPLERKVQVTQAKIMEWYMHYDGKVAVSYSGGKDSGVLLDLARRVYPDIQAVYVDTGLEYAELREHVKTVRDVRWVRPEMPFNQVIERYGYPVISKEVSKRIYYARRGSEWAIKHLQGLNKDGTFSQFSQRFVKWAHLVDAPFLISEYCCTVMKKRPLHFFQKETGKAAIIGTMASESARRQSAYLMTGCNAFHSGRSQPMSFWLEQDVLRYLKLTGLSYPSVYGDIVSDKKASWRPLVCPGRAACSVCWAFIWKKRRTAFNAWS